MKIYKNVCIFSINIIVILICLTNLNGVRCECSDEDWECDNGQCISDIKLCDGKVDCSDRSDEIAENCIHFAKTCQKFAFSCAYGACIDGKAKCNGVQDCADNSDELMCVTKDETDFQGVCAEGEIQCGTSNECINSIKLCDGRRDCSDGSDESLDICIHFGCTDYGFQCGYGACISGNAKCNNVKDCADGSDESWALCETPRKKTNATPKPVPLDNCLLPNKPELQHIIFRLHPRNRTITMGSYVSNYGIIHMECKDNFKISGHSSLLCKNGDWEGNFPICANLCDAKLLTGLSTKAICDYKSVFKTCPKKINPGTEIQINCLDGYEPMPGNNNPQYLTCLKDGTFDKKPSRCTQRCGKITSSIETLSKGGIPVRASTAPWHVAIYENNSIEYIYTCSGSIVSPRIVLSAAHCFWDEPNLLIRSKDDFQIIAGQGISTYTNKETMTTQIRDADAIIVPTNYQGKVLQQKDDIAFVKLQTALIYTDTVAPICIVPERPNTAKFMRSDEEGIITGYGENNQLQRLTMTTLDYYSCAAKKLDYIVADDKFCIYSKEYGAICRGDSGGGFIQGRKADGLPHITYFLLGIISNTPTTTNDCTRPGKESFVAITNLQYMSNDFKEKLNDSIWEDKNLF